MNDNAARRNGRCCGARPVGPWYGPHDQGKTRRGIVARGRDLRFSRGEGSACVLAHGRVVIANCARSRHDPRVPDADRAPDAEHQVTPLELFFDLVFVFAITQVTSLLVHDPTWGGVLRGLLVLAALWWAGPPTPG